MFEKSMKAGNVKINKGWLPFRGTDFHSIMYPLISCCYILGLYPCKVKSNNFIFSRVRYAYATVIIIIFVSLSLTMFYHVNISGKLKYDSVQSTLQFNFTWFLSSIITVLTYALSRPRIRVFQNLAKISARLPPETLNKMARWIHVKDLVGLLFLLAHVPNVISQELYITILKAFFLYTTTVVVIMDMVYMNCVCVLKACFGRINDCLQNLKETVIKDEAHVLQNIYVEQRNALLLIELRALKKQHSLISDVVQILNTTFGSQIIATVVLTFEEVTFSLYFYLLQRVGVQKINLERQIWYSYFITSVALYSIKLSIAVWFCETGKDQALEVGTNIHEILSSTTHKQIKEELQIFSLQVMHRSNVFSARGFNVDAALLTKIAGGVTTYLLILIQFLLSMHNNNN